VSKIYTHPSGGQLFQLGRKEIPSLVAQQNIDLIIFAAKEYQPRHEYANLDRILVPLTDSPFLTDSEIFMLLEAVDEVSTNAASYLTKGKNVISSCHAGLNRSGIITAFILAKLTDVPKQKIIEHIRILRHPEALSNKLFEALVLTS